MKILSHVLLDDLSASTQKILDHTASQLETLSSSQLNWKPASDQWSILECLQHLNLYGEFYLPAIQKAIRQGKPAPAKHVFKSGLLGNYFAQSMLPKAGKVTNKMKTFKDKDPQRSQLPAHVLATFIQQQKDFLRLLQEARRVDLNQAKTPITLTSWIQLKLGDTFRFVINHHLRHFVQIETLLAKLEAQQVLS